MEDLTINNLICIFTVLVSLYAFSNEEAKAKLLHIPYRENRYDEKIRMLTSGFIHSDAMHLLFNMIALFSFGSNVEYWFQNSEMFGGIGGTIYLTFYVAAILASSFPTYLKHKDNPHYAALGASGAIAAVIFVSIINNPMSMILMPFPMPGFIFGIFYLWYEHRASKNFNDNIGHDAHLYGAIFGILFVCIFKPSALLDCFQQIIYGVGKFLG